MTLLVLLVTCPHCGRKDKAEDMLERIELDRWRFACCGLWSPVDEVEREVRK